MVNSTFEIVIDDCSYSIKLVEEWGCHLGDDAFLTEDEKDSRTEVLSQQNDAHVLKDVQGEFDDLVNDLNKEWM